MKKYKILIVTCFFSIFFLPSLKAETALYDDNSVAIAEGETICANQEYTLNQPEFNEYQNLYILNNKHQLEEVIANNQIGTPIVIPKGIPEVSIAVLNTDENYKIDFKSIDLFTYKVKDCNKTEIKDSYKTDQFLGQITYTNDKVKFSAPTANNITNYSIQYQYTDGVQNKSYNLKKAEELKLEVDDVLQVTEKYQKNNKSYSHNYEIRNIRDNYYIREVDSFKIKSIKFDNYINPEYGVLFLVLLIFFFLFRINQKKYEERKEKFKKHANIKRRTRSKNKEGFDEED